MAPGGYTAAALKHHLGARVFGITLPAAQGGHHVLLDETRLSGLKYLDVTMLVKEFTKKPIPLSHPDRASFNRKSIPI
jgi:hypothetical protein